MYWVYAGLFVAGAEGLVDIAVEEGTVLIGRHNTGLTITRLRHLFIALTIVFFQGDMKCNRSGAV